MGNTTISSTLCQNQTYKSDETIDSNSQISDNFRTFAASASSALQSCGTNGGEYVREVRRKGGEIVELFDSEDDEEGGTIR